MSKKVKKKPADYAQFSFRIKEDEKNDLNLKIEEILNILKSNQNDDDFTPKKNALIIRALNRGLNQIIKELSK